MTPVKSGRKNGLREAIALIEAKGRDIDAEITAALDAGAENVPPELHDRRTFCADLITALQGRIHGERRQLGHEERALRHAQRIERARVRREAKDEGSAA